MTIRLPTCGTSSGAGLVAYLTCGDPNFSATKEIALAAIEAGTDVLELGVPFSDPIADGPVIQRASERALATGASLEQVLSLAAQIRKAKSKAGLIIFSYLNPILRFGLESFAVAARQAGVDGSLATDLTVEEAGPYCELLRQQQLATIFLAAPTSSDARLKKIANTSSGFVYAVSRTGVTGTRQQLAADAKSLVMRLRRFTKLPIAVGFGISNREQFHQAAQFADAVVVGSAIVKIVEAHGSRSAEAVGKFIRELKAAPNRVAWGAKVRANE